MFPDVLDDVQQQRPLLKPQQSESPAVAAAVLSLEKYRLAFRSTHQTENPFWWALDCASRVHRSKSCSSRPGTRTLLPTVAEHLSEHESTLEISEDQILDSQ
jgi:hypothetical protein